ncbi:hypothetical protein [uncultured Nocardioides sp.]|uniref:hypothetical protein n=1 Tax=uncultured Nocardioides sp. TaxID=198441 RepID=UPI0026378AFD|nr:hypothetical protein [uncultured Nocardioides sp.]
MSTMTTLAPWTNVYRVEHTIAPVSALRLKGDVCLQSVGSIAPSFPAFMGAEGGVAVVADERTTGTPAWSPPDCR